MDQPDHPETRLHYDSDWLPMYIVLACIPVIFVSVALYSKRRDHVLKKHDLEMARYTRARFPWKDAVNASENMTSVARLPAVPPSFGYGESNKGMKSEASKKAPPPIPQINVVPSYEVDMGIDGAFAQADAREQHPYRYGNGDQNGNSRYPARNYQDLSF